MEIAIGLLVVVAFVVVFRAFARRSEDANTYLDETEDRKYKSPPSSGGYTGM